MSFLLGVASKTQLMNLPQYLNVPVSKRAGSYVSNIDVQWSWQTIVMGFGFLAFLLITRQIVSVIFLEKKPNIYIYIYIYFIATLVFTVFIDKNVWKLIPCTGLEEAKTFLGFSSCTTDISYSLNPFGLLPQIKGSWGVNCKNYYFKL